MHALKIEHSTIEESIVSYSLFNSKDLTEKDRQNLNTLYPPSTDDLNPYKNNITSLNFEKFQSKNAYDEKLNDSQILIQTKKTKQPNS